MNLSGDKPAGTSESPGEVIARLEAAVARLRDALARRQDAGLAARDADRQALEAENRQLREERDRLQQDLAALRQAHERLKARSDSAGVKINRTIRELEAMLGERSNGPGHG